MVLPFGLFFFMMFYPPGHPMCGRFRSSSSPFFIPCNYSAMPPAGRFLKKAPQKLSGCTPFCSLGRIQSVNQYLRMNRNQPQNLFVKLFKSLAPGRAAGGNIELNSHYSVFLLKQCNFFSYFGLCILLFRHHLSLFLLKHKKRSGAGLGKVQNSRYKEWFGRLLGWLRCASRGDEIWFFGWEHRRCC